MKTLELNSTQMTAINTSFYDSYLTGNVENDIDDQLYTESIELGNEELQRLYYIGNSSYVHNVYKNQIGKAYRSFFDQELSPALTELKINSIKFVKVISPREYNFTHDNIVLELEFDKDLNDFAENEEFLYFIKTNEAYQGCVGFVSNVPKTKEDFLEYTNEEMKLAIVIEFLLSISDIEIDDLDDQFIDYIQSNGHNSIPYNKSFEKMVELARD